MVTGARQTGKTWLIRDEIEKSGYIKFEVNFIDQPDMVKYLNAEMSAEEFPVKLKMIMPENCKPDETVVFFDEIQKCPEIVTKIKFLVDEGSFKYVMSGSLLGAELKEKFETYSQVDEFIHLKLLSMFFVYLIVGGMPDAVKTYSKNIYRNKGYT